jgi:hypothetical protein
MSILTKILAKIQAVSSSKNTALRVYPQEKFETDVMDEIVELKQTVHSLSQMIIIQQQQISTMQQVIYQHVSKQYNDCSFQSNSGNTTTINNYYGASTSDESRVRQSTTPYPSENDYTALVLWLEEQKIKGIDYYAAAGMNRSKMCRQLSDILGWAVDQNSLRKAQNR